MTNAEQSQLSASGYLPANDLRIYYEVHGAGHPLILLHGGAATSQMWHGFLPRFEKCFKVITIDSRGHGKTINPSGYLSYNQMADDVAAFVQAARLEQPLICGYSDGGQIALELGMRYPGIAKAYVVGGAYGQFTEKQKQTVRSFGLEAPGKVDFDYLQKHMPDMVEYMRSAHALDGAPERWRSLWLEISGLWWTPLDYKKSDYEKMQEPVLIMLGDRDEFVAPADALAMYEHLPKSELAIIPNASHMAVINPDSLFAQLAIDFLKRSAGSV